MEKKFPDMGWIQEGHMREPTRTWGGFLDLIQIGIILNCIGFRNILYESSHSYIYVTCASLVPIDKTDDYNSTELMIYS